MERMYTGELLEKVFGDWYVVEVLREVVAWIGKSLIEIGGMIV